MSVLSLPKVQLHLHDFSGGHRNLVPKQSVSKQFKSSNVLHHKYGTKLNQLEREATFHIEALNKEKRRLDIQKQISQQKLEERLPLNKRKLLVLVPTNKVSKNVSDLEPTTSEQEQKSLDSSKKKVHFEDENKVENEEHLMKVAPSLSLKISRSTTDLGGHQKRFTYSAVREMRQRREYKDRKTAFIHFDFAPASMERLEELSEPAYHGPLQALFAKKRRNKESIPIRPRSICQLKNIDTKAYETLMGRMKPKFAPVESENELIALQNEIVAEKKEKSDKRKLVPQPVVLPSFESLSKDLHSCRYLHNYNISFPQV